MSDTLITEGQKEQAAIGAETEITAATTEAAEVTTAETTETTAEQKPEGAPEKYEFTAPEGSELAESVVGAFSEVAKELNLSQESAQKVLDKMAPALAARQQEQFAAAREAWAESAKADKEFGGAKLTESLAAAKVALDAFGTPELTTLLNESGLGNHPDVIRFMVRAGKAISEDKVFTGKAEPSGPTSIAQRLYPNMNP